MEEQYVKKYFLTGFMLISSIIIYSTMIFVMFFIAALLTAYGNILISFLTMTAILIGYFFSRHKFDHEQNITKLALYYALSICLLGLLIPGSIYLVVIGGYLVAYGGNVLTSNLAHIVIGYFIYTELFSILGLFTVGFELRELENRSFKFNLVLTTLTVAVIYLVLNGFQIISVGHGLEMLALILLSTFYVLNGVTNKIGLEFETIEDRYRFVVNSLGHAAIAPINIPFCMACKLKSKFNK